MSTDADLKTDIALIKKDVKQIEKFFDKVDNVMSEMSDITKSLAVQQQILEHFSGKIEEIEQTANEHKQEDIERTKVLHKRLEEYRNSSKDDHKRLADQSARNRAQRNEEIMEALSKLNGNLEIRMDELKAATEDQESRLQGFEKAKWWLIGVAATVTFMINMAADFDFSNLFS